MALGWTPTAKALYAPHETFVELANKIDADPTYGHTLLELANSKHPSAQRILKAVTARKDHKVALVAARPYTDGSGRLAIMVHVPPPAGVNKTRVIITLK